MFEHNAGHQFTLTQEMENVFVLHDSGKPLIQILPYGIQVHISAHVETDDLSAVINCTGYTMLNFGEQIDFVANGDVIAHVELGDQIEIVLEPGVNFVPHSVPTYSIIYDN